MLHAYSTSKAPDKMRCDGLDGSMESLHGACKEAVGRARFPRHGSLTELRWDGRLATQGSSVQDSQCVVMRDQPGTKVRDENQG